MCAPCPRCAPASQVSYLPSIYAQPLRSHIVTCTRAPRGIAVVLDCCGRDPEPSSLLGVRTDPRLRTHPLRRPEPATGCGFENALLKPAVRLRRGGRALPHREGTQPKSYTVDALDSENILEIEDDF